jgi:hypothetical protein
MPSKINKAILKNSLGKAIYPLITLIFMVAVLFLFSKIIFFLTDNINKAFSDSSASLRKEIPSFDLGNYELIRVRFGWPDTTASGTIKSLAVQTVASTTVSAPHISAATSSTSSVEMITPEIATSSVITSSSVENTVKPQVINERSIITVVIFNGTGDAEAALKLQNSLQKAGFSNVKIDSRRFIFDSSVLKTKNADKQRQKYFSEIKKVVISSKRSPQVGSFLNDDTDYDVLIMLGKT